MIDEKNIIERVISRLEQLQIEAVQESVSLKVILDEITKLDQAIVAELTRLSQKRNESGLSAEEQLFINKLIQYRERNSKIQSANREVKTVNYNEQLRIKIEKEVEKGLNLDEKIIESLYSNFSSLTEEFKEQYYNRISQAILSNESDAKKVTGLKGAVFEMSRINLVVEQGQEKLMENVDALSVEYSAFQEAPEVFNAEYAYIEKLPEKLRSKVLKYYSFDNDKKTWTINSGVGLNKVKSIFSEIEMVGFLLAEINHGGAPVQKRKSEVDIDVPIKRKNKKGENVPYIYETKAYPRRIFGKMISNYNQLLKYDEAVNQGLADGISVEIEGRIDPDFLKWAAGASIEDLGAIPSVEIIYNLPLPSGNEYRFVLKRTKKENGLAFRNNDKKYTDDDKKIIAGIQKGIIDKSIFGILSELNSEDFSENIKQYVANPGLIDDAKTYYQYEKQYKETLWKKLLNKSQEGKINTENKRSAISEYANRSYVESVVIEYQAYLSQNPEIAKAKKSYILMPDKISEVIEKIMEMIQKISNFEISRQKNEFIEGTEKKRVELGYRGQVGGVALDIEHIMIDAIQDVNKKGDKAGRSYNNQERFQSFIQVAEKLKTKESQRYIEIEIYDPEINKFSKQRGLAQAKKLENELIVDNLKRLEKKVSDLELENKRDSALKNNKHRIEKLKIALFDLNERKNMAIKDIQAEAKKIKDFSKVKEISEYFMLETQKIQQKLIEAHIETIGGKKAYEKIAKRISRIVDQDIVKYIYTANSNGSIVMDEEVIRSDVSGRAAHSELAQGRNIYGAGEMVFAKHSEIFRDYAEWKKWSETANFDKPWRLTEINNGSGHYRPSVETLKYVENLVKKENKGNDLNIAQVKLNDSIMRGLKLKEAGVFV